jgi:PAS domain S-box-containing protein
MFGSEGLPHGFCFLWNPGLLWLHVISDSLIALAYFLIPIALVRILRTRRDIPFNWIFLCFAGFIVACGITHVMEVVTLWHPFYWISGGLKAVTAAISLTTFVVLVRITPGVLAMPGIIADRKFRELIETASDSILQVDAKGTMVLANQTTVAMFGYSEEELLGRNVDMLLPQANQAAHANHRDVFMRAGVSRMMGKGLDLHGRRKDGSEFSVEIGLSPVESLEGVYVTAVIRDVTSRKQIEQELANANARVQSVLESTTICVMAVDSTWTIGYLNGNARTLLNVKGDVLARNLWEAFPGIAPSVREKLLGSMSSREPTEYEAFYEPFDLWTIVQAHPWDNGGITIFFTDVSAQKRLERELNRERLMRAQRIESLAHMAGGLAHEISNPLGIIHARASDLLEMAEEGEALQAKTVATACGSIVKTSNRAMGILEGLRMFARDGVHDPMQSVKGSTLLEQAMELVRPRFEAHGIKLEVVMPSDSVSIECREVQIRQVLLNLLNNAFDAIDSSADSERWVRVQARVSPAVEGDSDTAERFLIEVIDGGPGVAPEQRDHLMEAFFTTKPMGGGMGVGLSLSSAIARDHGGKLEMTEIDGHTCFRLSLLLLQQEPEKVTP